MTATCCNMFQNNALYHPEPAFTSVRGKRKQRHLIVITMPKRLFFTKHIILKAFLYTMPLMNYSSIFTHSPELNLNKDHTNAKSSNSRHQKYCFELLDHCIRSKWKQLLPIPIELTLRVLNTHDLLSHWVKKW